MINPYILSSPKARLIGVLRGDTYDTANTPISNQLYGPNVIYNNGATYFAFNQQLQLSLDNFWVCKVENGSVEATEVTATNNNDYHNHPVLAIDENGYIIICNHQHSTAPTFFKSDSPYDISSFSSVAVTGISGAYDYPKLYHTGSEFVLYGRRRTLPTFPLVIATSTNGVDWTQRNFTSDISQEAGATTDARHYPINIYGAVQNDWVYMKFYKRSALSAGGFSYNKLYHCKTPVNTSETGKVIYSIDGLTSYDLASAAITEAQLNSSFLVWNDATISESTIGPAGPYYNGQLLENITFGNQGLTISDGTTYPANVTGHMFLKGSNFYSFYGDISIDRFTLNQDLGRYRNINYQGQTGSNNIPYNIGQILNKKVILLKEDRKGGTDSSTDTIKADIYIYEVSI
jgi:hypothetical protein